MPAAPMNANFIPEGDAPSTAIGSTLNTANQVFDVSLERFGFMVGDRAIIGLAHIRGDLSADGLEYIDVGIGTAIAPKARLGENGYGDNAVFRTDGGLRDTEIDVIDLGGGVPGFKVYVSPAPDVNFSPLGMPNGWWWQLCLDVKVNK